MENLESHTIQSCPFLNDVNLAYEGIYKYLLPQIIFKSKLKPSTNMLAFSL